MQRIDRRSAPARPKCIAFRREFLPKDLQWLNLGSRVESNDVSALQTQCVRRPAGDAAVTRILPAQDPAADLVLIHRHILTVDANDSVAPRFLEYPELELSLV
jgi:hypothetical protein